MAHRLLAMMEGFPGAGKTSLADGLIAHFRHFEHAVEPLPEEAIFTRPEFAEVGHAFKTKTFPTPALMLAAYRRVFTATRTAEASIIADWNALGMIEDLPCAQPDRVTLTTHTPDANADVDVLITHAHDVREAWQGPTMLLVLEVPATVAVERAATQRGSEWIQRHAQRWDAPRTDPPLEAIARGFKAYDHRRQAIIRAHESAGWQVQRVDAQATAGDVLHQAIALTQPYA